jgi:hypothetical protein
VHKLTAPPYKGESGAWLTEALFYNRMFDRPKAKWTYQPLFDLYDNRPGLINCRETFVNLRDPTGRRWALAYLGDWNHWLRLIKCPWFREAYDVWMAELNLQLKSEAIQVAYEIMKGENGAQALAAAKFIAGEEYNASKRGRPSKAEVTGELKKAVEILSQEDEDFQRMGLKVIQGGNSGKA